MTDKILNFPLESSPKTKFSGSLFQISQSTNHGPHELNVRRTKKVQIELEPNETTFSLFRINEELLGQMKQMQYQMMKMNGAAGPDNGTSEHKRMIIIDVRFKGVVWEAPQTVVRQCLQWAAEGKPESCKLCNIQQLK